MTFDNEETVAAKVSVIFHVVDNKKKYLFFQTQYALDQGLGGVMVWSIDTDDFMGQYIDVKYPLLTSIYNTINKS